MKKGFLNRSLSNFFSNMFLVVKTLFVIGIIISIGGYIAFEEHSFSAVFLLLGGGLSSSLLGGQAKAVSKKWESKMVVAHRKRDVLKMYELKGYQSLWDEGYKTPDITKYIEKNDPKRLNTK